MQYVPDPAAGRCSRPDGAIRGVAPLVYGGQP